MRLMTLEEGRKGALLFTLAARKIVGEKLIMTALYGSSVRGDFSEETSDINLLLIASSMEIPAIDALASPVQNAKEDYRLSPIFMESSELPLFARLNPVRFIDILSDYEVLYGSDVLKGTEADHSTVRLRARSELLSLRLEMRRSILIGLPSAYMLARSLRVYVPQIISIVRVVTASARQARGAAESQILTELGNMKRKLASDDLGILKGLFASLFSTVEILLESLS